MIEKHPRLEDKKAYEAAKKEYCEICGSPSRGIGPHHIFTRGSGGPDMAENFVQPCWDCHYVKLPAGKYSQEFLLSFPARRLGISVDECRCRIRRAMGYAVEA